MVWVKVCFCIFLSEHRIVPAQLLIKTHIGYCSAMCIIYVDVDSPFFSIDLCVSLYQYYSLKYYHFLQF